MSDDAEDSTGIDSPLLAFRRASIDDYSTIRYVQAAAVRSLCDKLLDEAEVLNATRFIYSAPYVSDLFSKTLHVALLNGDIVGTCAWEPSDDRGSAARISALFVAPLFQNSGIGTSLVETASRDATANGFDRFMATVPVSIVPLFTALDFVIASYGTSRDIVPEASMQVAFLRKP